MQYTRVLIAKVALRIASEDEVFWVDKCIKEGCGCAGEIENLRALADLPKTMLCLDEASLIEIGDQNKRNMSDEGHIFSCHRCARIGQYIANMPFPSAQAQMNPLARMVG
jgi:hypothetical protein